MPTWCVIPARYASTRLPGKPLVNLAGKPMIQWVYERAKMAKFVDKVLVATDDQRVFDAVKAFGGEVVMTSPTHPSGTDRVAEALGEHWPDVIINLQGDEPMIDPDAIDQLATLFDGDNPPAMATLCHPLSEDEAQDPSKVKVVFDQQFQALYFSRSPIPYPRDEVRARYYLHVGIYAFRADTLRTFINLPPGRLEKVEKLEQLRALENGIPIRMAITQYRSFGVDTTDDAERMERILKEFASTAG